MTTDVTIEIVSLEEIHDLAWPTDGALVASFRKTLQQGAHFAPIQLNRLWRPDATWHYEVIDGFHRYEAAKAEGLTTLLCQVVERTARDARYARIQACIGKPAHVTMERALQELRRAFIEDMRAVIGSPEALYEPIIGEDGEVHARLRAAPLPDESLQALEALTDHLQATTSAYPIDEIDRGAYRVTRTPFGVRTGWEQKIIDWLAELGERFGYDTHWLLKVLRMQALKDQGFGQGWSEHQRGVFSAYSYGGFASQLWSIPDVDLRAWFRRKVQARPEDSSWLSKIQDQLNLHYVPALQRPLNALPKSHILTLINRYPSPRDLYIYLRDRSKGSPSLHAEEWPLPAAVVPPPQRTPSEEPPAAPSEQDEAIPAVFAIVSSTFGHSTSQPEAPSKPLLPSVPVQPDPAIAYQPVHEACRRLLEAMQQLTEQYGQAWRLWEGAQADLAVLRAAWMGEE